ncbi:MAG: HAD family phosphatase [Holdemanella sp.]|nr:HAD family phosphatase [Holdemanella sp.]
MFKAIVMDMDGTLLNSSNHIPEKTKDLLMKLQRQGVKIILASGRSYMRLLSYGKELELEKYGGYFIEVDGIAIYDLKNQKRDVLKRFKPEDIREVYAYIMKLECEVQAVFDDGLYAYFPESILNIKKEMRRNGQYPEDFPWTAGPWGWLEDMSKGYPDIHYIQSENDLDREYNKVQCMQEEKRLAQIYKELMDVYGNQFELFRTCPRQVEILPKGYNKGKTLKRIMDRNGWNREDVIAFGDGENDVSLFDYVEASYAMGNAAAYVKERAKYITDTNDHEGIYQALIKEIEKGLGN